MLSDRPTLALLASACTHVHWSFCNVPVANYGNPVVPFSKFVYSRGVQNTGATFDFRQSVQWWDLCLNVKSFALTATLRIVEQGLCSGLVSICHVRLLHLPTASACSRFAAVGPADRRYRSIAEQPAARGHIMACISRCGQCHIVSIHSK